MMNLELVVSCSVLPHAIQACQLRAWVDPQPERGLDSEVELLLEPRSDGARRAEIRLDESNEYLFYRVGIVAHPSTVWHLLIQDQKTGRVLHEDSDLLALPKGYVVGSCQLHDSTPPVAPRSRMELVWGGKTSRPAERFVAAHILVP